MNVFGVMLLLLLLSLLLRSVRVQRGSARGTADSGDDGATPNDEGVTCVCTARWPPSRPAYTLLGRRRTCGGPTTGTGIILHIPAHSGGETTRVLPRGVLGRRVMTFRWCHNHVFVRAITDLRLSVSGGGRGWIRGHRQLISGSFSEIVKFLFLFSSIIRYRTDCSLRSIARSRW